MTEKQIKDKLSRYRPLRQERDRYLEELSRLPAAPVPGFSSIPRSSGISNPTEKAVLRRMKVMERVSAIESEMNEIESMIEGLSDSIQRLLLIYRYVDGLDWPEICVKLDRCQSRCYYFMNLAMQTITLQ